MSRRKAHGALVWDGDAFPAGEDLVMVMRLAEEPDRVLLLNITPSTARRLNSKISRVLTKSGR